MTGLLLALAIASQAPVHSADNTCLRAITYKEAGNQPVRGVAAVRQVILNRARKRKKSVCAVVKERGQFSSYKRGMRLSKIKMDKKFLHKYSEAARMRVVPSCTMFFHTKDTMPSWTKGRKFVRVVKDHKFYC